MCAKCSMWNEPRAIWEQIARKITFATNILYRLSLSRSNSWNESKMRYAHTINVIRHCAHWMYRTLTRTFRSVRQTTEQQHSRIIFCRRRKFFFLSLSITFIVCCRFFARVSRYKCCWAARNHWIKINEYSGARISTTQYFIWISICSCLIIYSYFKIYATNGKGRKWTNEKKHPIVNNKQIERT